MVGTALQRKPLNLVLLLLVTAVVVILFRRDRMHSDSIA